MKKILFGSVIVMMVITGAFAEGNEDQNMALKVGTLGLGVDYSTTINKDMAFRFNINGASTSRKETIDSTKYDGDLKLLTVGALLDYYPSEGTFRLTAGAYYNANKFDLVATPSLSDSISIGDNSYTGAEIGHLNSTVEFNKIAPYIGLGWGNKPSAEKGWGFTFDLGAMYQGSAIATAEAIVNNAVSQTVKNKITTDVEQERQKIEDDMGSYTWYPVIMIGVNYTF